MYSGQSVSLDLDENGIAALVMDASGTSANVLNETLRSDLDRALAVLSNAEGVKGLVLSSAKKAFVLGADVAEFPAVFEHSAEQVAQWLLPTHDLLHQLEALPIPTVAAVNGMALGGGLELALACDFRVCDEGAQLGFPEVGLGLCPGWGGTVRSPRLVGAKKALAWMVSGRNVAAADALVAGLVDEVVPTDELLAVASERLLSQSSQFAEVRAKKHQPHNLDESQQRLLRDDFGQKLDPNFPAAAAILDSVLLAMDKPFAEALELEAKTFGELAAGSEAKALVGNFLNDQWVKKKIRQWSKQAVAVKSGAVLGAGIMGGGIAYQSALNELPIIMKDINTDALELGTSTASGLLDRSIKKGKMDEAGKQGVLDRITPQLDFSGFSSVDYVVEAVVEREDVKKMVLVEVEQQVSEHAILASNTSTISIDSLAAALSRPEQFCGMHFFNPVHAMRLVEVIRGKSTSDATVASTVSYAAAMGKTPIVVRDCPGFLVNRVLFPYFNAFNRLLMDGVDFQAIDQVMETFGWPMGPAYLADVIGLDTMVHADQVLQAGFPERMAHDEEPIIETLLGQGGLGQKNGWGFYEYGQDENGRRTRKPSAAVLKILDQRVMRHREVSDEDIIQRLMIPMCLETARCLDEGIIDSAAEGDMGLGLGLGFPRFRGGALRYIDSVGIETFAGHVAAHRDHGPLYQMSEAFERRVADQQRFYPV